jgi:hypothetical protein
MLSPFAYNARGVGRQLRTHPARFSRLADDYGQLSPQIEPASPTQMLSQVTAQQYGSDEQISVAQLSQFFLSFPPVLQTSCLHVPALPPPPPLLPAPPDEDELLVPPPELLPPPLQLVPQMEPTSPTQTESQRVLQQYESCAQISVTQVSHPEVRLLPVEQSAWLHAPPPLLLPEDEPPPLLPPDEPPEDDPPLLPELLPEDELPLLLPEDELPPLLLPELLPDELPLLLPPELLPVAEPQSAAFGVPHPVGPSKPGPALQMYDCAALHVPFDPLVTSLKSDGFEYGNCGVAPGALPVAAKIDATSGELALVPPTTIHPPVPSYES